LRVVRSGENVTGAIREGRSSSIFLEVRRSLSVGMLTRARPSNHNKSEKEKE